MLTLMPSPMWNLVPLCGLIELVNGNGLVAVKQNWSLVGLLAGILLLGGCAGLDAPTDGSGDTEHLENTYWKLVTLGEDEAVATEEAREAHLVLHAEDARLAGATGCNRMMGGYELDRDQLSFGQVATTMMACPAAIMEFERKFLDALGDVASWQIDGEMLTLIDGDGEARARFEAVHLQ
ncbi:META domain-containing protein [Thioalkalivibrio sp. ALJ16]|uniref:META domain-containing protein n=1 Tax=Thioalkalivibrio sp. ALJ16 TaxID=1158762 RepID=UPI00037EB35E|nr:META domain-containing protein [Thioalkalivibrio sp. ALJ16]